LRWSRYLWALAPFLAIASAIFIGAIWAGHEAGPELFQLLKDYIGGEAGGGRIDPLELALAIFFNNTFKDLMAIGLGPILGLYPLLLLAANGVLIGSALRAIDPRTALALIPHGILEIPAMLISAAIGLSLAKLALSKWRALPGAMAEALRFFALRIVPMNLAAAFLEVYASPLMVDPLGAVVALFIAILVALGLRQLFKETG